LDGNDSVLLLHDYQKSIEIMLFFSKCTKKIDFFDDKQFLKHVFFLVYDFSKNKEAAHLFHKHVKKKLNFF
jgi:hypothetical protein